MTIKTNKRLNTGSKEGFRRRQRKIIENFSAEILIFHPKIHTFAPTTLQMTIFNHIHHHHNHFPKG